jgi:uncharacterized protein (TIGR02246 family)
MNRSCRSLALSMAACLSTGCSPGAAPDTSAADAQIIRDMVAEWIDYYNAEDAAGLISLYVEDMVNIGPLAPATTGTEALRQAFDEDFSQYESVQTATVAEVRVEGDLGFGRGTWRVVQTSEAGGEEAETSGKWLWIVERQPDDAWRIIRHIWNQDLP